MENVKEIAVSKYPNPQLLRPAPGCTSHHIHQDRTAQCFGGSGRPVTATGTRQQPQKAARASRLSPWLSSPTAEHTHNHTSRRQPTIRVDNTCRLAGIQPTPCTELPSEPSGPRSNAPRDLSGLAVTASTRCSTPQAALASPASSSPTPPSEPAPSRPPRSASATSVVPSKAVPGQAFPD